MNFRSVRDAVWACDVIGGSAKLVALRLVEHWPRIFPSIASLVKFTGLSERTVRDALRELEAKRVIQTQHRDGTSSTYSFVGVSIPALGTPAESAAPPRQNLPDPPAKTAGPTPAEFAPKADPDLLKQPSKRKGEADASSPPLMPHEAAEARKAARAAEPTGAQPAMRYEFPPDWIPRKAHIARGLELGLTEAEIWQRVEDVRLKPIRQGFTDEDKHFMRELTWARDEKETRKAKEQAYANRRDFETPGHARKRA